MRKRVAVGLGLVAVTLLAGCLAAERRNASHAPAAIPTAAPSSPAADPFPPDSAGRTDDAPLAAADAGVGGLTVRHLDTDGTIKTIRVEDFRQ